ncbi:helix-turn-helix transcriptional regulator [Streptomyces sp. NPDC093516]|uniref:helix-turn-helix transcriptional regulator n=1 Tax=Streptomyces sp. NPDC093516 TaxID=3155304 RepID=UPI003427026C
MNLSESGNLTLDDISGHPGLSPTDSKMLSLLVAGVTDKAIASQMNLSRRNVQRRIRSLMERAGVGTRMQLAWQAARRGWLRRETPPEEPFSARLTSSASSARSGESF